MTQRREVNRLAPGRSIEGDVDGVVQLQVLQVIHVDAICEVEADFSQIDNAGKAELRLRSSDR